MLFMLMNNELFNKSQLSKMYSLNVRTIKHILKDVPYQFNKETNGIGWDLETFLQCHTAYINKHPLRFLFFLRQTIPATN